MILVSAESLQTFVIKLRVNGRLVAPNLSRLVEESLYFSNVQDQTHLGTTSDAEFAVLQGLYPVVTGVVSQDYWQNRWYGLPRILADNGYSTLSAAAEPPWFWRMQDMHSGLGFQTSLFEDFFIGDDRIGPWLADGLFFDQMVPVLARQPEPFVAFLITSSNHSPYEIPERHREFDVGEVRDIGLRRYLESVHYFDRVFGEFVDNLRASGNLDRSVLVVYGDHQAFLHDTEELALLLQSATRPGLPYSVWRARRGVPLIVRLPSGAAGGERDVPGGHVDVPVTILGLLGIEDRSRVMLGRDLTASEEGLVVFRDGGYTDGTYWMEAVGRRSLPVCFHIADAVEIDCRLLERTRRRAAEYLRASDMILRHDLIPLLSGPRLSHPSTGQ